MTLDENSWWERRSPLDRLLRRVGLLRHDPHDARRIVLAFVGLTWFPLVAIELVVLITTGHVDLVFRSPAVHARLLVAIPMYMVGERLFESRTSMCIRRILDGRLIHPEQGEELRAIVRRGARRRDSVAVEAILLLASIGVAQLSVWQGHTGLTSHIASEFSAGLVWYGFVSSPVFLFLLFRWLWNWASWALLLGEVSRLQLLLMPTHPDRAGGLGFLIGPILGIGPVLFGSSAVIAATFAARMLEEGTPLKSFGPEVLVLLIGGELLALGPLFAFFARLFPARFSGIVRYGALAIDYTRLFNQRWVETGDTKNLLGTSDIQSLADMQNAYHGLEEMRGVPFGKREVLLVGLVLLLPMVPLLAIELPIEELLSRLMSSLA